MIYLCPYCGIEFDNKYKLGGHKIRCIKNPKHNQIVEAWKKSFNENKENHKIKYKELNNEVLHCKYCGKECVGKNSLVQHEIRCKENPNKKLSGFELYNIKRKNLCIKGENQFTKAERLGLERPIVSEDTKNKLRITSIGTKHSNITKEKISKSYKEFLNNHPEKAGFIINHSSKQSYPEKYFEELFKNEHIDLKYHKQIKRYQLDFYNDNLQKYVEIDGNQHNSKYMIQHDIERTKFLEDLGWIGFRIKWSDYKKLNETDKKKLILDIKEFLNTPVA